MKRIHGEQDTEFLNIAMISKDSKVFKKSGTKPNWLP